MKTIAGGVMAMATLLLWAAPAVADDDAKPSPIPEKLAAQAKKTFAQKKMYFIWTDDGTLKAKDAKLHYAVNPDLTATPARTVIKLTYRGMGGKAVPWWGISPDIELSQLAADQFKGAGSATVHLIKETDVIDEKGRVNPAPEKAAPISNVWTFKVQFQN